MLSQVTYTARRRCPQASGAVAVTGASSAGSPWVCHTFSLGDEEVNHVAVHPKGDRLAAGNDGGEIAVVSLTPGGGSRYRTLRRVHRNIVSSVAWRPNKPGDLLSASLDASVVSWDVSNGSVRRTWTLSDTIADVQLREEEHTSQPPGDAGDTSSRLQMVNPPLGHSVRAPFAYPPAVGRVLRCADCWGPFPTARLPSARMATTTGTRPSRAATAAC